MAPSPPVPRDLDGRAIAMVLLLSALWGGNTVAVKIGVVDSPPLMLAALRFAIGGACVLGWGLWTRAPFRLGRGEGWPLLGLGVLFATQLGLLNANMSLLKTYRPSGLAAFTLTTPLFGVLATALVIGEPIGGRLAASALLVAGGIAVATLLRDRAAVARTGAPRPVPGGVR
jgi:drug/metabolite transporter (DMT)-like permease